MIERNTNIIWKKGMVVMRKTVVISPYEKNISGTLTHFVENQTLHIKLNLSARCGENDILRLYALSTSHAALDPYLAEIYDGNSGSFPEAKIEEKDVLGTGYKIPDFDTFVITRYNEQKEEAIAAAFLGLEWSAAKFLKKDTNANSPTPDTPMDRAKEILGKRKGTLQSQKTDMYANEFRANASKYHTVSLQGADGYSWYKITDAKSITRLSGVAHALSNSNAISALKQSGHYLAGICKSDFHHIAIAIPECRHICPMPQLSDCCEYVDGYHIAGIFLANDGQYFEKCLQKA